MSQYRLSAAAQRDIHDLWDYIAADNPIAADNLVDQFYDRFLRIAASPKAFAAYPDPQIPFRFSLVKPYVIFFAERNGWIEIVRVIHGHRDIPAVLE